ncbi:MAG: hypothetical protein ABWY25_09700 [Paenisporosarcina sp.]
MNNESYLIVIFLLMILSTYLLLRLISQAKKIDGQIVVKENEDGKKVFSLELNRSPDEIENMKQITFKVANQENEEYEDFE